MNIHRYPWTSLVSDYFRAVVGMVLGAVPIFIVSEKPIVTAVFAALFVLFAVFGIRTVIKHRTEVGADEEAVRINLVRPRTLRWRDLSTIRLKYYSPRRKKGGGWFQLTLSDGTNRIVVDSGLSEFKVLAAQARKHAESSDLPLDPTSIANLQSLESPIPEQAA